ncbi:MAG: hypothetical protein LIP02_09255 [Bacteroidales bacterium]|nr:hypothetical protein [Bacteroidales bacterium]
MNPRSAIFTVALVILLSLMGCGQRHTAAWAQLDTADSLMESQPDTALQILQSIDVTTLGGSEERGRYSLLHAMALDKCWIDTTDLGVIDPATQWYTKHGTPDERLKMWYYRGRIARNADSLDIAMQCYIHASEYVDRAVDTLAICRLYVEQSIILFSIYDYEGNMRFCQKAADLYSRIGKTERAFDCVTRCYTASLILEDSVCANDFYSKLNTLSETDTTLLPQFAEYQLSHAIWLDDSVELQQTIKTLQASKEAISIDDIDIVIGLDHLGRFNEAEKFLSEIEEPQEETQRLKYLATSILTHASNKNYEKAYKQFLIYDSIREHMDQIRLTQQLQFSEEKHSLELMNQKQRAKRIQSQIIGLSVTITLLLIIFILILRQAKLREANKNRQIQIENFQLRIMQLEVEANELKQTIKNNEFSNEIASALRDRIEALNALTASAIANDPKLAQPYEEWANEVIKDQAKFLHDTKLAFTVSHPHFIKFLEEHDLTEQEIGHACLYAIGLRGSEIGYFLHTKDNYNICSRMRAKFGLKSAHSNISQYLQRIFKRYK